MENKKLDSQITALARIRKSIESHACSGAVALGMYIALKVGSVCGEGRDQQVPIPQNESIVVTKQEANMSKTLLYKSCEVSCQGNTQLMSLISDPVLRSLSKGELTSQFFGKDRKYDYGVFMNRALALKSADPGQLRQYADRALQDETVFRAYMQNYLGAVLGSIEESFRLASSRTQNDLTQAILTLDKASHWLQDFCNLARYDQLKNPTGIIAENMFSTDYSTQPRYVGERLVYAAYKAGADKMLFSEIVQSWLDINQVQLAIELGKLQTKEFLTKFQSQTKGWESQKEEMQQTLDWIERAIDNVSPISSRETKQK